MCTSPTLTTARTRYDARIAVEEELKKQGLLRNKYPKPMKLGFCSRSGDVIEPMIMPQWFVDCSDMARRSCEAVRDGRLKITPKFHEHTWYQWLGPDSIRPWCVASTIDAFPVCFLLVTFL